MLDGVVISGGEPTLQGDLIEFMQSIKELGFLIKLDTNGSHPEVLREIFKRKLVDYIAMDVKHSRKKLQKLVKNDCEVNILLSIELIKNSSIDYEFRSTILPAVHDEHDIRDMGKMIAGAKRWYLQNFRPLKTLDKKLSGTRSWSQDELINLQRIAQRSVKVVGIRNAF